MAKTKREEEMETGLNALFNRTDIQEKETEEAKEDVLSTIEDEELREALHKKRMDGRGRPRKSKDEHGNRTDGYGRTSLILNKEKSAKIKEIAFRETLTMKEIFELAMDMVIAKYEETHGEVIPRPERYKGDIKEVFK